MCKGDFENGNWHSVSYKISASTQNFKMEPIPGDYKEMAQKHFGETEENRRTKIEEFRQLLMGECPELLSNIPGQEDSFLLKFLRAGNFEIQTAVQVLKNYIFMIKSGPQYFSPASGLVSMRNCRTLTALLWSSQ